MFLLLVPPVQEAKLFQAHTSFLMPLCGLLTPLGRSSPSSSAVSWVTASETDY